MALTSGVFDIECTFHVTDEMKQKHISTTTCLIPLKAFFKSKNANIQNIIERLNGENDFNIQVECIRKFAIYIEESTSGEEKLFVVKLLAFLFVACIPKHPLKKTLLRILTQIKNIDLLAKQFSESIKIQIHHVTAQEDLAKKVMFQDYFISAFGSSLDLDAVAKAITDNINLIFNFVFSFLLDVVDCLWERKPPAVVSMVQQQRPYIYNATKFLLSVLQKCSIEAVSQQNRLKLITCCYDIIRHKIVAYDIKGNCGHMLVLLFTHHLPEDIISECTFKEHPYLEFLKFGKEPSPALEKLGLQVIEDSLLCETFKVCVYMGLLIVVPRDVVWKFKINDELILPSMFTELIESSKRAKGNPTQTLVISKAISAISSLLSYFSLEQVLPLFNSGLDYAMIYLDDRLEVVRNYTKTTFENLLKLAVKHSKEGKPILLDTILQWLKDLPNCGARYIGITLVCSQLGCAPLLDDIPDLAKQLLIEMNNPSMVHSVSSCYETLMQTHLKEVGSEEDWVKYWVDEIIVALKKSEPALLEYFQRLFISAFHFQPNALKALTKERYLNTDNELIAFLGCIHSARKKGIQLSVETLYHYQIDPNNSWRNLLKYKTLEILQTHQNDDIRILVIAIIVDSQRTTETFTQWEMQFLPKYLYYNINMSNASKRQQIIGYAKKAMTRAKDSIAVVRKSMDSVNNSAAASLGDSIQTLNSAFDTTAYYNKFWEETFNDVLLPGLNPDSNYGRRSACLELLHFAFDHLSRTQFHQLWHKQDLNNLKYILQYDTYERNKDLASKLLTLFTPERLGFHSKELVQRHIDECLALAISIKPTQTISAAYMLKACLDSYEIQDVILQRLNKIVNLEEIYKVSNNKDTLYLLLILLVFELQKCYAVGKRNLQEAAASKPIHGFVFCVRHLLKTEPLSRKVASSLWRKLFHELLHWCFKLNELMKTIICNQSPEGYLPEDSDNDIPETDETAKAQMVTVYGWRAAKEISLLFGEIALTSPAFDSQHPDGIIDERQFKSIGEYFFSLLINTKHRGAFEQASLGFSNMCYRLWRMPTTNINQLPALWLQKILNILLEVSEETVETCATRRSAGVPFMVQAILITEPKPGNEHLHLCMKKLIDVGGDFSKPDEQRIHCLNILRALYRNNQLSEFVIPYCARGMIIAITGFGSNIWGIRNSATLLFSALLVRMFGVPRSRDPEVINIKNKMIVQVFFVRYPDLYAFLLSELKKGVERMNYPTLFPVLLMLSRLYYSTESSNPYKLEEYLLHIQACLANPVYRIRDLAAKTCVNLLQPNSVPKYVLSCLLTISNMTTSNSYCHGILLQLQYLLQLPHPKGSLNIANIIDSTAWILICCNRQISHLTATLYLEILMDLIREVDPHFENCEIFKKISSIFQWQAMQGSNLHVISTAVKKYKMHMFNLKLYLLLHTVQCHHDYEAFGDVATYQQLVQIDLSNHSDLRNMCISYVNFMKFSDGQYANHNLFEENNSEHAELTNKHLKPLSITYKQFLYEVLYVALEDIMMLGENAGALPYSLIETSFLQLLSVQSFPEQITDKSVVLHYFVNFCKASDEQTVCAAIANLDNFLRKLPDAEMLQLDFDNVFNIVLKYCSPSADVSYRLGMCRLLVSNKRMFHRKKDWLLSWSNLCMIWETVFLLLEDDDEVVRNTICQLCQEELKSEENDYTFIPERRVDIPEYTREILLNTMVDTMPTHCSIDILLSWILRGKDVITGNISEVFDEGELNTYAELYPMAKVATKVLHKILWTLEDGINFEDKSIFIEEQSLVVATTLYDKFIRNFVPLITDRMNTALKNILARAIMFLERVIVNQPGFKVNFRKVFNDALSSDVVKALDPSELVRLKMFLGKMFKVVLWD